MNGAVAEETMADARVFAANYYAGYHDWKGQAATEPFAKDLDLTLKFNPRLLQIFADETLLPQLGRRFGQMVRQKHQGESKAKPNLSHALALHADKFLTMVESEKRAQTRKALGIAKEAHQRKFFPTYLAHLKQVELRLKVLRPELYDKFEEERRRFIRVMATGPIPVSAEMLARYESDSHRLLVMAEHFGTHPDKPVLSFWEWDAGLNPDGFGRTPPPPQAEARS